MAHASLDADQSDAASISSISYFEQLQDYFEGILKGQQKI